MNLIKLSFIFTVLMFFNFASYADNHDKKKLVDEVKKITTKLDSIDEEMPLNDPFAGNEASSSVNMNIPEDEAQDEMSLYNFKLVGLVTGKNFSYISLIKSDGEPYTLTIGQYLGKIKLVDLRLNEAIFIKDDKKQAEKKPTR